MAFSTNATRSSAANSVLPLRTGRLTTATITLSNIAGRARDHVEMAVRDGVVGAGTDGDAVIRGHEFGSGCRRSGARRAAADRAASGARRSLSVTTRASGASTGVSASRARSEPARVAVWRVEEDEIVLTSGRPCASRGTRARAGTAHFGAQAERRRGCARIARSRPARSRRASPARPARERLDRQRAGAREQVEHARPSSGPRIENSASRTRSTSAASRRPGARAARAPPRRPRSLAPAHARIGAAASAP